MKIAAFNVENLFDRAKAFNEDPGTATETIESVAELNTLFEKDIYGNADKQRMLQLVAVLKLNRFNEGPLALHSDDQGVHISASTSRRHRGRGHRPRLLDRMGGAEDSTRG